MWHGRSAARPTAPSVCSLSRRSIRFGPVWSSLVATRLFGRAFASEGRAELECRDHREQCDEWAHSGECLRNSGFMATKCCASCKSIIAHCTDHEENCKKWAEDGECRRNVDFMLPACPKSCRTCHLQYRPACRRNASVTEAVQGGDVDATFRRVLKDFPQYRPSVLHQDPWILQLDRFLEPWEADRLAKHAGRGLFRSLAGDQVKEIRTSFQVWCASEECLADGVVQALWSRVSNVTRVPRQNAENLQLLRYEPGQAYDLHHDQNSLRASAWGPRLYTLFMYLSDVEEGGETAFPKQNVTVRPRKGRALLWPSVHSDDPFAMDDRTFHQARPVTKGLKYAANFWLHMYDYQGPFYLGCQQTTYVQDYILDELWPPKPTTEL